MIYCTQRKIGVFLPPRNGSVSTVSAFKNLNIARKKHSHINYTSALEAFSEIEDFSSYKFYCFYRDPVDRFISTFKHLKRSNVLYLLDKFFTQEDSKQAFQIVRTEKYNRLLNMAVRHPDEYNWLSQELKDKLESVTVEQALTLKSDVYYSRADNIQLGTFSPQTHWMNHDIDLTLLNFADFDNQLTFLLSQFGATADSIPHQNQSITLNSDAPLTQEEIDMIKAAYQEDYDFFASKGITFP